jgi:flavorubredoxin
MSATSTPPVPETHPYELADDTWLITNLAPAGPDGYLSVNSMVIRGEQPIVVDTGAPVHRERWFEQVFSLVEPDDIRWVFLSHDDGDHRGNLAELLELAPNATLVCNFFITERVALEEPLPLQRMRWLEPGDTLDLGDRTLRLVVPPIFDGPTTRGVYDDRTGVLWAVDSFAALTPGAVHHVADVPTEMYVETFRLFNSMVSPWHRWLDRDLYARHVDSVEALRPLSVASAHGPVLTGEAITEAFDRVRAMAGAPIVPPPGPETLEEMIAAALAAVPA